MIGYKSTKAASNFLYGLIRLLRFALVSVIYFYATPIWSQQQSDFEKERHAAYDQFSHGHLQEAIKLLQNLVPNAPTKLAAANLERDLIEVCSTGYFLKCYYEANEALFAALQSDKELSSLYPELMLYVFRERIWFDDKKFIQQVIDNGGASMYAFPPQYPATYAQMQLALHAVYVNKNDLKTAEEATSSAIMGLLLTDPKQTYTTCKILVGLLSALLTEQDIVGAFQLLAVIDPYVSKQLSHESTLYADYLQAVGLLFSFTSNNSTTVATLTTASDLYKKLDIAPEIRDYNMGGLISLSSAALAIDGKLDKARELHAQHPMQSHKDEIIKRGFFQNLTEFYYAVTDVFLSALSGSPPDYQWKALFEKKPIWDLSDYVLSVIDSYRSFSLACLELGTGDRSKASSLFIDAAEKRLSIFERFQRVNFEGFQLTSLVDKLVIGVALKFAAESRSPKAANLMLRGSEVLLRNLRYAISDQAILLASQPDEKSRRNAHAYINLVQQKRDWELKNITQWLNAPNPNNGGAIIQEYTSVVTTISKLKTQFLNGSNFVQSNGLPSVTEIQNALSANDVFVTYFPMMEGFGRLCIDKVNTTYSFGTFDQTAQNHARLLEFATTAAYGPNPQLDSQYPVDSAIYLKNILFGGLEKCMKVDSHLIMSLPKELSGVPVAALLKEAPPRLRQGYDLKRAHWLIRDYSFSFVVSARQYLAVATHVQGARAPLEYLGVGDPKLDDNSGSLLASAFSKDQEQSREKAKFVLTAIPDTANEVRAVAETFNAEKRDILLGKDATEEEFRSKSLADYDVIHFATHGVFEQDSKGLTESALIFTPGTSSDSFNDGMLSASEISRLSLQARLVVLSACNSAKYNQQQANLGVHDLQAAFTVAGAPTILAALWPIDSATATDIMVHFFSDWRSGQSVGAARSLAQTIRAYLERSDQSHQHPRFWAPFAIFGDGSIAGKLTKNTISTSDATKLLVALKPLEGFKSGGEIIDSAHLERDLILSLMGDWDGKRMAGIISARNSQGVEKWRITSKEVAAGKVTVLDDQIFVLGSKGIDHFTPVIRSFDPLGRELWSKEYSDFIDYDFVNLVSNKSTILVIAHPRFLQAASERVAYLLKIDRSGNVIRKVPFKIDTSRISLAAPALIQVVGDQVIVEVNNGYSLNINLKLKSILGFPLSCFEGESVSLFYFGLGDLNLLTTHSIANFRINEAMVWNGDLVIGGESLDNCSQKGFAAVLKARPNGTTEIIWKDDDIFPSAVRGIAIKDGLIIAVNYERSIGINVTKPVDVNVGYVNKRWGDDNISIREASLFHVLPNGSIRSRQDISAGLSVYIHGVIVVNGIPVVYGGLGGEPALSLH